nr:MAG TPA_asm: DNA-directed RNA polymerase [Bacteriophage sp.]
MGLMKCPDCKRKISRHADVCPYCDQILTKEEKENGIDEMPGL